MPDAFCRQRQAVARGVAGEEDVAGGRVAELVRDPVALVADRFAIEAIRQLHRRLLDVEAGVEGADTDPHLVTGGEAPPVAGRHDERSIQISRSRPRRRDGPRGLARAARQAADSRSPRTRRHPSASTTSGASTVAAVGDDRSARAVPAAASARPRTVAVSKSASLCAQSSRRAPCSRRSRTSTAADAVPWGVWITRSRTSGGPSRRPRALRATGGRRAGRGLALADLVAVEDQHPGAGAGQLPCDRQPCEARTADHHVVVALEARSLAPRFVVRAASGAKTSRPPFAAVPGPQATTPL